MSYGANLTDAFRQVGVYAGRRLAATSDLSLPSTPQQKYADVFYATITPLLGHKLSAPEVFVSAFSAWLDRIFDLLRWPPGADTSSKLASQAGHAMKAGQAGMICFTRLLLIGSVGSTGDQCDR